jgi:hypothetical protein
MSDQMAAQLVGTLTHGEYKAQIFSTNMPGEFKVAYSDADGKTLEEAPLTGISSYRQRESEITDRLRQLADGQLSRAAAASSYQSDAGKY